MKKTPHYLLIGDENTIQKLYQRDSTRQILKKHLPGLPENVPVHQILSGEKHKSLETLKDIWNFLVDESATKQTILIGFGGGVVTDIVGFAAATYFRGIRWIAVPTSLLAMVDATVGGKTAIDFRGIKNQIGAFHEPIQRVVDTDFLSSLPQSEWSNGMAEVIKISLTSNPTLWKCVTQHSLAEMMSQPELIRKVVLEAIQTKQDVVSRDKLDQKGIRDVLNFGHTVGHAIESFTGMPHGQAVSLGMLRELLIGDNTFVLRQRVRMVLEKYGLPTRWKQEWSCFTPKLQEYMAHDKKGARIITLREVGVPQYIDQPTISQVQQMLNLSGWCQTDVSSQKTIKKLETVKCHLPSSKSETNRVLILAALGRGSTQIINPLLSEDTLYMTEALQRCGVNITLVETTNSPTLLVEGIGYTLPISKSSLTLEMGQSGTCFRFLVGFLTALTWHPDKETTQQHLPVTLTGEASLLSRPIQPLMDAVASMGHQVEKDHAGQWTIYIQKTQRSSGFLLKLPPQESSQFLSSLLLSQRDGTIVSSRETKSQSYISLTMACARSFGKNIHVTETNTTINYHISTEIHQNPDKYTVEMDATALIYPVVWGLLQHRNVEVFNWFPHNKQGDATLISKWITILGGQVEFSDKNGAKCVFNKKETLTALSNNLVFDMDSSDTFMTFALLGTLLPKGGLLTLKNIENQNLKESRRIDAIVDALQNIGLTARYQNDYLVIKKPESYQEPLNGSEKHTVSLSSRQDHRLAMTFAILSLVTPIQINDVECVEKTFPHFFSYLSPKFGCQLSNQSEIYQESYLANKNFRENISNARIILVGMPGSGKTYLGKHLADKLGYQWVDTDQLLLTICETSCLKSWIAEHGWTVFREKESYVFQQVLDTYPNKTIISTGGGLIENNDNRRKLKMEACVIWLDPTLQQLAKHYPRNVYGVSIHDLYQRRKSYYQQVATHRLVNTHLDYAEAWLNRILNCYQATIPKWSSFLCLGRLSTDFTWDDTNYQNSYCIEYRPDLIQANLQIDFPINARILYTYKCPGELNEEGLQHICDAIRDGSYAVDVELHWKTTLPLQKRKQALVIGSCHCASLEDMKEIVSQGWERHQPDILKLVGTVETYHEMVSWANKNYPDVIKIMIAGGEDGIWTRIINPWLTPVCHPALGQTANGQMSLLELEQERHRLFNRHSLQTKGYFLIGDPILQSPGFKYHNDIFQSKTNRHPRSYKPYQTTDIEEVAKLKTKSFFAGASVTCPLKEKVMLLCDWIQPEAKEIGAVNTVVSVNNLQGKPFWRGFNTDWIAVQQQLKKCVSTQIKKRWSVAIVGTGGMARACAYACYREGLDYWVIGRNSEKGEELVQAFETGKKYLSWDKINIKQFDIILVCVSMEVPVDLRSQSKKCFIVEMSYHKNTKHAYPIQNSNIISGMDIFYLQAEQQQKIFYN